MQKQNFWTITAEGKLWRVIDTAWPYLLLAVAILFSIFNWSGIFQFTVLVSGILCVLLAAKGNIWNYAVGAYNSVAYSYTAFINGLFGEVMLNLGFFLPTSVIGFLMWRKKMDHGTVIMRRLSAKGILITAGSLVLTIALLGFLLSLIPGQKTPYIDAATNMLSIAATILMMKRYREQWALYILLNVLSIIMWAIRVSNGSAEGAVMVIMWSAYLANAVYGFAKWSIGAAKENG